METMVNPNSPKILKKEKLKLEEKKEKSKLLKEKLKKARNNRK
jgi:hypothetical protein